MIGYHVAQRACGVEVSAALFDTHSFCDGDLHVVHVAPVPDGLEDSVAEAEHQDVLDRFLAEIMIDAEDLVLSQDFANLLVQLPGGFQVTAERLFEYNAPPLAVLLASETGSAQ